MLAFFDPKVVGRLLGAFVLQNSTTAGRKLQVAFDGGYFLNNSYSVARQEMIEKLPTSVEPTFGSRSPDLHKKQ